MDKIGIRPSCFLRENGGDNGQGKITSVFHQNALKIGETYNLMHPIVALPFPPPIFVAIALSFLAGTLAPPSPPPVAATSRSTTPAPPVAPRASPFR